MLWHQKQSQPNRCDRVNVADSENMEFYNEIDKEICIFQPGSYCRNCIHSDYLSWVIFFISTTEMASER